MVTSQGSDPGVNRRVDDALMLHVLYCMPYFPCHDTQSSQTSADLLYKNVIGVGVLFMANTFPMISQ